MAQFDSADLLARFRRLTRVPSTSAFPATADIYAFLTEAQLEVVMELVTRVPGVMMGDPVLMTSADSGVTYTFGTDASARNIVPIGSVEVYRSRGDIGLNPLVPGHDFVMEGDQIRWVGNVPRVYSDGPYARFVTPPQALDGSTEPTLPIPARLLIVYKAAVLYAMAGGQQQPDYYEAKYQTHLNEAVLPGLRKQFRFGTAAGSLATSRNRYYVGIP